MHARLNDKKQYPHQCSIEYHRDNSIVVSTSRCGLCSYSAERTQVRFLVIPFFALPDDAKPNHWSRMLDTPVESNCVYCRLDAKDPVFL